VVLVNASFEPNSYKEFYESPLWFGAIRVFHGTWAGANVLLAVQRIAYFPLARKSNKDRRPLAIFALQLVSNGLRFLYLAVAGAYSTSNLPYELVRSLMTASQPVGDNWPNVVYITHRAWWSSSKSPPG
jgi:hypothetical protein